MTAGSPLTTLYGGLLDERFGGAIENDRLDWWNIYRTDDYIGGEVKGCPDNRNIGKGGHTGCWNDPKLIEALAGPAPDGSQR